MAKILLLHGINHAMFGKRDPKHYGTFTLQDIESAAAEWAAEQGCELECYQTDIEGELARKIHQAFLEDVDAIVINAGAWTHYSYGLTDALAIFKDKGPIVEIHMSNVHAREEFRHKSVFSHVVIGQISGFGLTSYKLGITAAADALKGAK
jgi:3-dehydroquinate dehydratase-2